MSDDAIQSDEGWVAEGKPRVTIRPSGSPEAAEVVPVSDKQWPGTKVSKQPLPDDVAWPGKKIERALTDQNPDIDYNKGAAPLTQINFLRQSNRDEVKAYLKKTYGDGNYGQDEKGSWWVTEDVPKFTEDLRRKGGKIYTDELTTPEGLTGPQPKAETAKRKVAIFPDSFLSELAPGMLASAPAQAGAAVLGTAGAIAGGPVGGIAGAAVGGAFGKGLDELVKYAQGTYRKDAGELGSTLGGEAAFQGGAAALGSAKNLVPAAGKWAARKMAGVTPETKAMGQKFLTEAWVDPVTGAQQVGVIPPWGSVATKSRALEYDRYIRNLLSGDPKDPQRTQYMLSRVKRFLDEDLHMPAQQSEAIMQEVMDTSSALDSTPTSEVISDRVKEHLGNLRASATSNIAFAGRQLKAAEKALKGYANQDVGGLSEDVVADIATARKEFGTAFGRVYEDIHKMTGEEPVVPRNAVEDLASQMKEDLEIEKIGVPATVTRLAKERGTNSMWTVEEAHNLRTELRAEAQRLYEVSPLAPGPAWRRIQDLAEAVDDTFTQLADSGELGSDAAKALKAADAGYREGIRKFNDNIVQKVFTSVKNNVPPDPETIVTTVFTPGRTETAMDLWVMLNPEVRHRVRQVQVRNLLNDSSKRGEVDGTALLDNLVDPEQRRLLQVTHSREELAAIEALARGLSALDGKISPAQIAGNKQLSLPTSTPGVTKRIEPQGLRETLEEAFSYYAQIDEFAKAHPLKALASNNPDAMGRAADFIIEPGPKTGRRLEDTFKLLNQGEQEEVRRYALRKLLNSVIVTSPSQQKRVSGAAIEDGLKAYTPRQQQILFPGMIDDLKELARDARFLFPIEVGSEGSGMGQSLGAASIQSNLPKAGAIKRYAWKHIAGWIADNPKVLGMLVSLKEQDPTVAKQVRKWLYRWAIEGDTTGPNNANKQPDAEGWVDHGNGIRIREKRVAP